MTTNDTFGQTLATWLHEEAEHAMPDHLGEILVRTVATPQRKWWSSPERWLPLDTTTRFRGRIAAPRALVWLAVLTAVLLAVVGTAIFTGAVHLSAPLTGLATNGRIFVADGAELRSYAPDGTDPRVVMDLPNRAAGLTFSPDGSKLAMQILTTPEHVEILDVTSGEMTVVPMPPSTVAGDQISWSPSGDRIVFPGFDGVDEFVFVATVDGSPASAVGDGVIEPSLSIWHPKWSSDGEWISFLGGTTEAESSAGKVYMIHPDGSGLRALDTGQVEVGVGGGGVWSPDPGVQRLLYVAPGNTLILFDATNDRKTVLGNGFWPTWSPDGSRISYWGSGTEVVGSEGEFAGGSPSTKVYPSMSGSCQANSDRQDQAFCGPASWSPDGTRLIAPDISGTSILSLMADGSGSPILIDLDTNVLESGGPVAWQPIRP
jgi:hypothetical protein